MNHATTAKIERAAAQRTALDVALLCVALPVALLPALAIALVNLIVFREVGKVLFTQERVGEGGRMFRIYKFRTMRDAGRGAMSSWSTGGDTARVTRFGRLLRQTHLDELPQLLNVLRGEMSFIGPRPEMVEVHEWAKTRVFGFERRLTVKPGLTGLAQITQGYAGRDRLAYAEKLRHDLLYLREKSLLFDLEILVRTCVWVVRGKGWLQTQPPSRRLVRTATRALPRAQRRAS